MLLYCYIILCIILKHEILKYRPTEVIEPYGQIPALKPNFEEAEQATAFSYACSTQSTRPPLKPVSTADLQYALKVRIKKFIFFAKIIL